jgi:TetR/AcrR family transcriptional regulator
MARRLHQDGFAVRHRRAAETRAAILRAAADIFARAGLDGARTDAIAAAAGVNKALLYYYFKSKGDLYAAVLEDHLREFSERGLRVLTADESPSVTVLRYVSLHFDFISARPYYPVLFQRLMMTGGALVGRLARKYFLPLGKKFLRVIERGVRNGEFRPVDSRHTAISLVALTVFYFSSAPIVRRVGRFDPFQPAHLARRKREVLNFIRHGLFRRPEECEA